MRVLQDLGYELSTVREEVVRALEFMDREHRRVLTIVDVAAAAVISPRRLQELVRAATSESPMNVLRRIRLHHARQTLLDPAEQRSIGEIARDAQLLHLGRFSSYYAAEFGEAPSTTVRRVRTRNPHNPRMWTGRAFNVQTMERIR